MNEIFGNETIVKWNAIIKSLISLNVIFSMCWKMWSFQFRQNELKHMIKMAQPFKYLKSKGIIIRHVLLYIHRIIIHYLLA